VLNRILRNANTSWWARIEPVFFRSAFWLIVLTFFAPLAHASNTAQPSSQYEYRLRFYHTHTREHLDIVYKRGNTYIPEALDQLDQFLRDHRTGDVRHFDPRLFDLLYDLTANLHGREIDVICGYRTPWSNEFLRTQAEAIDIRLPGIPTSEVRDAALRMQRGGVGYYPVSNFVHVDVGRVRRW